MSAEKYVGLLMASRNQAHAFHLTTKSFAEHKGLQAYYEGIVPLVDAWAEAYMGKYGRLKGVPLNRKIKVCPCVAKKYFTSLVADVKKLKLPKDPYLKAIDDEIMALLRTTLYLLSLK
jgi:hypothetical protein